MRNGLKLYLKYVSISLRGQLQYRASVIMSAVGLFFLSFIDFAGVWILFDRFGALKEWTMPQVALFYGIIHMAFALAEGVARGFDSFSNQIKTGDFDRILLRPRSTALQIMGQEFMVMRIGRFLQGLVVLLWAAFALRTLWTIPKLILLAASILGGTCLFSGLFILGATLCFWTVEGLEIVNTITDGGVHMGQYPITIYTPWFRKIFTFIIPVACINYFPVMGIISKADPLASGAWIHWVSPAAGVLFLIACLQIWKIGVRHYCSTGS